MVNCVIGAVNYVIAARPSLLKFMIADTEPLSYPRRQNRGPKGASCRSTPAINPDGRSRLSHICKARLDRLGFVRGYSRPAGTTSPQPAATGRRRRSIFTSTLTTVPRRAMDSQRPIGMNY
jgi:hypothetical protein